MEACGSKTSLLIAFVVLLVFAAAPVLAATTVVVMDDFEDHDTLEWDIEPSDGYTDAVELDGEWVGRVRFGGSCWGNSLHLEGPERPDFIQWRMRADGEASHESGVGLFFRTNSNGASTGLAKVSYHSGMLQYHDGSVHVAFMPAALGTWYLIELRNINWADPTYDLFVDGSLKQTSLPFVEPVDNFTYVIGYACPTVADYVSVDDIAYGFVNQPPVALDSEAQVITPGRVSCVDMSASLLNDANDPDGDDLTAHLSVDATHVKVTVEPDGTWCAEPTGPWPGEDEFWWRAGDGEAYSDPAKVTLKTRPNTDLSVVKATDRANAMVGETIRCTITVRNDGPDPATGVNVTDKLPPGLQLVSAPSWCAVSGA